MCKSASFLLCPLLLLAVVDLQLAHGQAADPKKESAAEKPLDPNRPKDAPPEAEVKKQLEKHMWGPPMQGGTKHDYNYKILKYGKPRKGEFRTDGVPANTNTTVYPLRVEVEIVKKYTDGAVKKEEKKQTYVFFKDEFEEWTFRFKGNE